MNERAQIPVEALLLIVAGIVVVTVGALYIKSATNTTMDQVTP